MTEYDIKEMAYREKLISEIEGLIAELQEDLPTPKPKLSLVREE
jgi:hypothetical protein